MNTIQVTEMKNIQQVIDEMDSGETLSDGAALTVAIWTHKDKQGLSLQAFIQGQEVSLIALADDIEKAGLYPREYSFMIDWINSKLSDRIV